MLFCADSAHTQRSHKKRERDGRGMGQVIEWAGGEGRESGLCLKWTFKHLPFSCSIALLKREKERGWKQHAIVISQRRQTEQEKEKERDSSSSEMDFRRRSFFFALSITLSFNLS